MGLAELRRRKEAKAREAAEDATGIRERVEDDLKSNDTDEERGYTKARFTGEEDESDDPQLDALINHGEILSSASDSDSSAPNPHKRKRPPQYFQQQLNFKRPQSRPTRPRSPPPTPPPPPPPSSEITPADLAYVQSLCISDADMGLGAQQGKKEDDYLPAPMPAFVLRMREEIEHIPDPSYCFLCWHESPGGSLSYDVRVMAMFKIVYSMYLRSSAYVCMRSVQISYNQKVRRVLDSEMADRVETTKSSMSCYKPWSLEQINAHFTEHICDPRMGVMLRYKSLREQERLTCHQAVYERSKSLNRSRLNFKAGGYSLKIGKGLSQLEKEMSTWK